MNFLWRRSGRDRRQSPAPISQNGTEVSQNRLEGGVSPQMERGTRPLLSSSSASRRPAACRRPPARGSAARRHRSSGRSSGIRRPSRRPGSTEPNTPCAPRQERGLPESSAAICASQAACRSESARPAPTGPPRTAPSAAPVGMAAGQAGRLWPAARARPTAGAGGIAATCDGAEAAGRGARGDRGGSRRRSPTRRSRRAPAPSAPQSPSTSPSSHTCRR